MIITLTTILLTLIGLVASYIAVKQVLDRRK